MKDQEPILTISTAAKLLEIHPRTLMSYEKEGFIAPHRTKTNRRMYSVHDIESLKFVVYLSQKKKVNIAGIKLIQEMLKVAKIKGIDLTSTLFPDFA